MPAWNASNWIVKHNIKISRNVDFFGGQAEDSGFLDHTEKHFRPVVKSF